MALPNIPKPVRKLFHSPNTYTSDQRSSNSGQNVLATSVEDSVYDLESKSGKRNSTSTNGVLQSHAEALANAQADPESSLSKLKRGIENIKSSLSLSPPKRIKSRSNRNEGLASSSVQVQATTTAQVNHNERTIKPDAPSNPASRLIGAASAEMQRILRNESESPSTSALAVRTPNLAASTSQRRIPRQPLRTPTVAAPGPDLVHITPSQFRALYRSDSEVESAYRAATATKTRAQTRTDTESCSEGVSVVDWEVPLAQSRTWADLRKESQEKRMECKRWLLDECFWECFRVDWWNVEALMEEDQEASVMDYEVER